MVWYWLCMVYSAIPSYNIVLCAAVPSMNLAPPLPFSYLVKFREFIVFF